MIKPTKLSKRVLVENLRCEYLENPLAVDEPRPRLGWKLTDARSGARQTAYRIQVSRKFSELGAGEADLWDTQKVSSDESQHISFDGIALESRTRCFWRVQVWDEDDVPSDWSEISFWEMGLLEKSDWVGDWIGLDLRDENEDAEYELPPSPYLRKGFSVGKKIKSARLYVTSLGLNEVWINGQRVGDRLLAPGWTDYRKRLYYNVYDVSDLVLEGENAMGAILSYGWYSGYIGYEVFVKHSKVKDFYGKGAAFLGQLEIEYSDGSREIIKSDASWKAKSGPVRKSDILMGESYDATKQLGKWKYPKYKDTDWLDCELIKCRPGELQAYPNEPVRFTHELPAIARHQDSKGNWVFDFGQNFAGVLRLSLKGKPGQTITLRHGEMLHEDGSLMTENLRNARATNVYVCSGASEGETWNPRFTYQGFRYAEVSGLEGEPELSLLTGLVIGSDTERVGSLSSSSPMINQLYQNIVWTQRANWVEIPTDCPQRDERLGWLGDAQLYINSGMYNMNVAAFFKKWMRDVEDAQWKNGAYANFAPKPFNRPKYKYSPAWMEAGIICPYMIYRNYGDKRILETHYESFKKLVSFHLDLVGEGMVYEKGAFRNVTPSGGWGDWLSIGKKTPKFQIANLYFGYMLKLMEEIASVVGKQSDSEFYSRQLDRFQNAFMERYVSDEGWIEGETQTLCAMAIVLKVLPESMDSVNGKRLLVHIDASGGQMETGFIGTSVLMPALSEIGRSDIAYKFLCSVDFPSWGYAVVNGATTVWERWNSYSHETGFYDPQMNSYSHYVFGAVCEWMFGYMAGIRSLAPGYRKVLLQPEVARFQDLNATKAHHDTLYGRIESSWTIEEDRCCWDVVLPANTSGLVRLPIACGEDLSLDGRRLSKKGEKYPLSKNGRFCEFALESGAYRITFSVHKFGEKESELVEEDTAQLGP